MFLNKQMIISEMWNLQAKEILTKSNLFLFIKFYFIFI